MDVVGCFGNDTLYVAKASQDSVWWRAYVGSQSTPTIADLDGDDRFEIAALSFRNGNIYAFEADGSPYRCSNGVFYEGGQSERYSMSSLAVATWSGDDTLSIIHPTFDGYVNCWKASKGRCGTDPVLRWSRRLNETASPRVGSPSVVDLDADEDLDVVVSSTLNWERSRGLTDPAAS